MNDMRVGVNKPWEDRSSTAIDSFGPGELFAAMLTNPNDRLIANSNSGIPHHSDISHSLPGTASVRRGYCDDC